MQGTDSADFRPGRAISRRLRRGAVATLTCAAFAGVTLFGTPARAQVETVVLAYWAAVGAMILFGPRTGTVDHFGFRTADGREFQVDIDSDTWLSQTTYASDFVDVEAARKILPLGDADKPLTFVDPEDGREKTFLIVMNANPGQVLQQIHQISRSMRDSEELQLRAKRQRYPLQTRLERLRKLKMTALDAKRQVDVLAQGMPSDEEGFPAGLQPLIRGYLTASQAAETAASTVATAEAAAEGAADDTKAAAEKHLAAARARLTAARAARDAAWQAVESWFSRQLSVLDGAADALQKAAVYGKVMEGEAPGGEAGQAGGGGGGS